ncbi:MAG: hypothetical protein CBARDMAM_6022 [uncultured Caballeronia sp.]|nr:MAG: hypothetical protein CBARDMAM_6022 [uncultured Caballeronia sp.]
MDLFDTLHGQIDAMRVPLYAVTVTAVARVNTPLVGNPSLAWFPPLNVACAARRRAAATPDAGLRASA